MLTRKVLFIISFLAILLGGFLPLAYAEEVRLLSDAELDSISAGGFDIDINQVSAYRSAVAAQSNIAAIVVKTAGPPPIMSIYNPTITNNNNATLFNIGDSAVAAQSNIAAIVDKNSDIRNATINNSNICVIENTYNAPGGVEARSVYYEGPNSSSEINYVSSSASAVAAQSNIAIMAALNGDITNSTIDNFNLATLKNTGDSALASQNNIAVMVSQGGDVLDSFINNTNSANVTNTYTADGTGTVVNSLTRNGIFGTITINHISSSHSAVAEQHNIGIIAALGGGNTVSTSITNTNIATVTNLP